MNTNQVERRLEALAAQSADPAVPKALFDGLAALEAGHGEGTAAWKLSDDQSHRASRTNRIKGITALGLAAAFVLTGSVVYLAGGPQLGPRPSQTNRTTGPVPTLTSMTPSINPSLPVSLGPWTQVQQFDSMIGGYRPFHIFWQDGQFVGVASGVDESGRRAPCALHSFDGRSWTCAHLWPQGVKCPFDGCVNLNGIAVHDGHFVAVGSVDQCRTIGGSMTTVVWTSNDGVNWQEQTTARFGSGFLGTYLLPTASGFVLTGGWQTNSGPVIWTSSDGVTWRVAALTGGAGTMTSAWTVGNPAFGFLAQGNCNIGNVKRICAAHSLDGLTWTISYPLAKAPAAIAPRLFLNLSGGSGMAYMDGRWTIDFSTMFNDPKILPDSGWYTASSTDGVSWTVARLPDPTLSLVDEGESFGTPIGASMWTMDNPQFPARLFYRASGVIQYLPIPGWTPGIYWSASGLNWVRVAASPAGVPVAIAETPTEVIAIMAGYATDDRSVVRDFTVFVAAKN
jgi:hypothetical protein